MMTEIKSALLKSLNLEDLTQDKLYSKDKIAKEVGRLFIKKISKNPVVIPVIIKD
jgi:phenylpyruvate tautomerase PptA (4-oxalocrotonate tautomerase family)